MFKSFYQGLYRFLRWLSSGILALNVLVIIYSVFTRYVLNHSPIWSDELSRYAIVASVMLAMSCSYVEGRHMRVSYLEQTVSQTARRFIEFYQWLAIAGVALFFAYISFRYALSLSKFTSMGLSVSKSIPLMSLPVGFMTLFLMALLKGPFKKPLNREEVC
ncbi:TRAP transporter small permease [Marinomonas fungiae]|uniref:TRAP transporter small permease protein n=1 Tax=Marinomonas fungiae TaxID=1137284 RepID=A0A0K6IKY1_9GAMM|nr:TRAP transporter small permease [Marinomonas fungiae]CUB03764.1 TRAP-type C4-dicarboxylate transport system, small permease component [Marinomonas fungiae]